MFTLRMNSGTVINKQTNTSIMQQIGGEFYISLGLLMQPVFRSLSGRQNTASPRDRWSESLSPLAAVPRRSRSAAYFREQNRLYDWRRLYRPHLYLMSGGRGQISYNGGDMKFMAPRLVFLYPLHCALSGYQKFVCEMNLNSKFDCP
jgi:hypothetical protein